MFANYTFKAERGRRTGMAFASGERENASERVVRDHLNDERKPGTVGRSTLA